MTMHFPGLNEQPHRRYNPLTGDWILVSPHRTQRPWQGLVEQQTDSPPSYDPTCYLCPGNERAGGERNPAYRATFAFDNDFSALKSNQQTFRIDTEGRGLLAAESESGRCRVVCFSPRHDLTLPQMSLEAIGEVVDVWTEEYLTLGSDPRINYVQIFENRGGAMGCSNPHPHCQIWANETVPNEPRKEERSMLAYLAQRGSCMLCDYIAMERSCAERVVCGNDHFVAVVPFWATWPFETLVLSIRHLGDLTQMSSQERSALADILKRLTTRYDNLFEVPFPYSTGFHQTPTDGASHPEAHFHAHFYPPLLRSATVKKFMVGYEMLASPQRDITPEAAADKLRRLSETHYSGKS